jgi:RHS repeat-associated protein
VNDIGQRTDITRSGSATPGSASASYIYNNRGELTSADEATNARDRAYQYDGIGNREKTVAGSLDLTGGSALSYVPNALNQYTTIPSLPATPAYDFDGNATAYPLPVAPTVNASLTYDGENRLIKVISGSTTVEYTYDAHSRRIAKTVGSTRTYYIYDGWNCVGEYRGNVHTTGSAPSLTRTYTHTWGLDLSGSKQGAGGVGGLLMSSKFTSSSAATAYYPLYDGNGNITAYIDNGRVVRATFDYDPFGNITNNNNTQALPYAFSTKPRETETGLYYYGYRFYDPSTGRWINRDPIEEKGGLNLYGFVGNDGVNWWDLLGLESHYQRKRNEAREAKEAEERKREEDKTTQTVTVPKDAAAACSLTNDDLAKIVKQLGEDSSWDTDDRHEEGGWLLLKDGKLTIERWPRDRNRPGRITPTKRPLENVIGDIHTHPHETGPTIKPIDYPIPPDGFGGQDEPRTLDDVAIVVTPSVVYTVFWKCECKKDGTLVKKRLQMKQVANPNKK